MEDVVGYTTQDQIQDLQKKIHLVEGDLHAYQEMTREKMEGNRSTIHTLRKQNKDLHKALAKRLEADATVIDKAFENAETRIQKRKKEINNNEESPQKDAKRSLKNMRIKSAETERTALRNKSGEAANEIIDQALCDQKKRLNALKSETTKKKACLKDLQTTYDQLVKEASFAVEMNKGESRSAQKLTSLENRLDVAKRKSAEAGHINKVYQMIHQYLEEESLSFHNHLDDLEQQIRSSKGELNTIRKMYEDAQSSRDKAKAELQKTEDNIARQRHEYQEKLDALRDESTRVNKEGRKQEKNKTFGNNTMSESDGRSTIYGGERGTSARSSKYTKSGQAAGSQGYHSTLEDYDSNPHVIEQTHEIQELEAHFSKIKEVTGVSELAQVVGRFEAQARTHNELEAKRVSNVEEHEKLNKQLNEARGKLAEQKYGGAGSDSVAQKYQIEIEAAKELLDKKKDETNELLHKANRSKQLVADLMRALGHLTEKLERVRLTKEEEEGKRRATISGAGPVDFDEDPVASIEQVDEYFKKCNERVDKLTSTLPQGDELERVLEHARTDDVYLAALETRMPVHNVRVQRLSLAGGAQMEEETAAAVRAEVGRKAVNGDDSESGEEDQTFMSRDALKKASNALVDSKSKKNRNRAGGKSKQRRR